MRGTGGRRGRRGYKLRDGQAFSGLGCVGRVFQAGGGGDGAGGGWGRDPRALVPDAVGRNTHACAPTVEGVTDSASVRRWNVLEP